MATGRAPLTDRSRCGIHGDPTGSGRCASCDADAYARRHRECGPHCCITGDRCEDAR